MTSLPHAPYSYQVVSILAINKYLLFGQDLIQCVGPWEMAQLLRAYTSLAEDTSSGLGIYSRRFVTACNSISRESN